MALKRLFCPEKVVFKYLGWPIQNSPIKQLTPSLGCDNYYQPSASSCIPIDMFHGSTERS